MKKTAQCCSTREEELAREVAPLGCRGPTTGRSRSGTMWFGGQRGPGGGHGDPAAAVFLDPERRRPPISSAVSPAGVALHSPSFLRRHTSPYLDLSQHRLFVTLPPILPTA
ncbi:hypothetical protein VPH35_129466 [Triticum aestivum]